MTQIIYNKLTIKTNNKNDQSNQIMIAPSALLFHINYERFSILFHNISKKKKHIFFIALPICRSIISHAIQFLFYQK